MARYLATSSQQDLPAPQLPDDIAAILPALQLPDAMQDERADGGIEAELPALQLPDSMQNDRVDWGIVAGLPADGEIGDDEQEVAEILLAAGIINNPEAIAAVTNETATPM